MLLTIVRARSSFPVLRCACAPLFRRVRADLRAVVDFLLEENLRPDEKRPVFCVLVCRKSEHSAVSHSMNQQPDVLLPLVAHSTSREPHPPP